jgi:CTP synthase (UTP-ammonia lyase)
MWIYLPFQVVPHITDEIQDWIERVAIKSVDGKEGPPDVCVIELGGTVGKKINFVCRTHCSGTYSKRSLYAV